MTEAMAASKNRSPSPGSRCRRHCCQTWLPTTAALCMLVLLLVPVVWVGAFVKHPCPLGLSSSFIPAVQVLHPSIETRNCAHGRETCTPLQQESSTTSRSPDLPGQRQPHPPPPGRLKANHDGGSSIGWMGSLKRVWRDVAAGLLPRREERSPERSDGPLASSAESALMLARTARGGSGDRGGRGWWFPGQRARRRRNLARAAERAAAKRAEAGGGGAVAAAVAASALPNGLANQGNTCYLNSLLQTLYHAPGLREAVFEALSGEGDGKTVSALGTVFRQLEQGGSRPASTLPVTRAMGVDPRVQQDAQEFGRFLFMALEGESDSQWSSPDTAAGGAGGDKELVGGLSAAIKELFAGRLMSYVECVDVAFTKEKEEAFYDLPMDIKGSGTLQKSLDRFIEAELLSGDNRLRAGEHGLQDARKGIRFLQLPPVLQFHLKRFEYDPYQGDLVKIHDRFEFPTELDMSPWMTTPPPSPKDGSDSESDSESERESDAEDKADTYKLSAVVMHVGGPAAGHYYAYVRYREPPSQHPPSEDDADGSGSGVPGAAATAGVVADKRGASPSTTWVKLDDHRVTKVSEAEVLRDAFGGGGGVYRGPGAELQGFFGQVGGSRGGGTASAYMLQYVREEGVGREATEMTSASEGRIHKDQAS
ncbi:unnamed protein product, partial [Ectocarpus sp. 12 AP-2014]